MKMIVVIALVLAVAVPAFAGEIAKVEEQGYIVTDNETRTETYLVTVGIPELKYERAGLARMLGSQFLANGVIWVNRDEAWAMIEYRMPITKKDFVELAARGPEALRVKQIVPSSNLPAIMNNLPVEVLGNIEYFVQFYSGALRIHLRESSGDAAANLADALNGPG